jgi:hypothetical protein
MPFGETKFLHSGLHVLSKTQFFAWITAWEGQSHSAHPRWQIKVGIPDPPGTAFCLLRNNSIELSGVLG